MPGTYINRQVPNPPHLNPEDGGSNQRITWCKNPKYQHLNIQKSDPAKCHATIIDASFIVCFIQTAIFEKLRWRSYYLIFCLAEIAQTLPNLYYTARVDFCFCITGCNVDIVIYSAFLCQYTSVCSTGTFCSKHKKYIIIVRHNLKVLPSFYSRKKEPLVTYVLCYIDVMSMHYWLSLASSNF
jgi:hypothetical protein